jgi:prepilin-type N-terminal cleavage/methylation domain-containing protein
MNVQRAGMTLIEVIMATAILAVCIFSLMNGIMASVEVFYASAFVHEAENVFNRGEAEYPFIIETDPEEDLPVSADSGIVDGWTFERTVDDYEEEDGLYIVRTRVVKGRGGEGMEQEYVRVVYYNR